MIVAGLVALVLLAGLGGAYFLLQSPSQTMTTSSTRQQQSSSSATFISISQTQSTSRTTSSSHFQTTTTTSGPAEVNVSAMTCITANGQCVGTLVNMGGTAIEATGCTFNGQTGVFSPVGGQVPPGHSLDITCGPAQGGAIPISKFHLEVIIQLSDGSSVKYAGNWQ